jgi:lipopolysaccharide export system protein LptA
MTRTHRAVPVLAALLLAAPALAQQGAKPAAQTPAVQAPAPRDGRPVPLGGLGANTKDPIKIDADRLDVFDREGRAVFAGNVVAVQGDSIMRCSTMTVYYEQNRAAGGQAPAAAPAAPGAGGDSSIKKIDCAGPVTVTAKTQVATGDNAVFDKAANKVILSGNVALSDGPNVTRGERIVYDLESGVANVESGRSGGRVKALFVPGSSDPTKPDEKKAEAGKAKTQ